MGLLFDSIKKNNDRSIYFKTINVLTKQNRNLYAAFFQLTPFCNLKCKMCYARLEPRDVLNGGKNIMRFGQWKWFIDEAIKEGLTELSFTGGECTLHPDFCGIYSYAYNQGLQIYIMTNAVHITREIFDLWKKYPPSSISITIYGSSADTYERLCGDRNAYKKAYHNIRRLDEAGFNLQLKYTAVRENLMDMLSADRFCREMGYLLSSTHILIQYKQCDLNVLEKENADDEEFNIINQRIHREREDQSIMELNDKWEDEYENICDLVMNKDTPKTGIVCSAARNTCYIDWEGMMSPCVAFDAFYKDPRETGFHECWKEMTSWADQIPVLEECIPCIHKYKCNRCIALHYNDTGTFNKVSPRLCWKRKYPEQAVEVEKALIAKGLLPMDYMMLESKGPS